MAIKRHQNYCNPRYNSQLQSMEEFMAIGIYRNWWVGRVKGVRVRNNRKFGEKWENRLPMDWRVSFRIDWGPLEDATKNGLHTNYICWCALFKRHKKRFFWWFNTVSLPREQQPEDGKVLWGGRECWKKLKRKINGERLSIASASSSSFSRGDEWAFFLHSKKEFEKFPLCSSTTRRKNSAGGRILVGID